eukprot:TRINITY_DN5341_c0_g1_i1.p1 TRINITY_DN5341_c0_g1~~TRINITY_DN5341_c0_g1_i1.p1  ORF type:complete len:112 (-),score=31.22 TRINITY_DN5341_c0_g1_i1:25-360(-)
MNKIIALFVLLAVAQVFAFSGQATYFDPGLGSCGWKSGGGDYICALNVAQYPNNGVCGRMIDVRGPKGSVRVKVVDKCPGCKFGDLDLSPTAFSRIADKAQGRVGITWNFV